MKAVIIFSLMILVLPLEASAEDSRPRHMTELTTRGFGLGGSYEKFDTSQGSKNVSYSDFDILRGNIAFNYSYTFAPRLQIGGFVSNTTEERHYETPEEKREFSLLKFFSLA